MAKRFQQLPLTVDHTRTRGVEHPDWLNIQESGSPTVHFGARQSWYEKDYQRKRGCGPVSASMVTAYLARHPQRVSLYQPYQEAPRAAGTIPAEHIFDKQAYEGHLKDIWNTVTPAFFGLSPAKYLSGAANFAKSRGISLRPQIYKTGLLRKRSRRNFRHLTGLIMEGLEKDIPVAMVLYHPGQVDEVKGWHWVTIVKIESSSDGSQAQITVADHGSRKVFSLDRWFYTSRLGGAFIIFTDQGFTMPPRPMTI